MSLPSEDNHPPPGQVKANETPSGPPSFLSSRVESPPSIRPSAEVMRLFWSLNDPLDSENTISVLQSRPVNGPREPYFRHKVTSTGGDDEDDDGDESSSAWHPISKAPVSVPGVSELKVKIVPLGWWVGDWGEYHEPHAEDTENPEDIDESGTLIYCYCCQESRPSKVYEDLVVKAGSSTTTGFVTIHDYVTAVHPWLMGLRDDLRGALSVFDGQVLPKDTKLVVLYGVSPISMLQQRSLTTLTATLFETEEERKWRGSRSVGRLNDTQITMDRKRTTTTRSQTDHNIAEVLT